MKILILFVFIISAAACARLKLNLVNWRERQWRFCSPKETPDYKGKACYRWCAKYELFGSGCKRGKTRLEVWDIKENHDKLMAAGFRIMRKEK